jgi:hypothetical protein
MLQDLWLDPFTLDPSFLYTLQVRVPISVGNVLTQQTGYPPFNTHIPHCLGRSSVNADPYSTSLPSTYNWATPPTSRSTCRPSKLLPVVMGAQSSEIPHFRRDTPGVKSELGHIAEDFCSEGPMVRRHLTNEYSFPRSVLLTCFSVLRGG